MPRFFASLVSRIVGERLAAGKHALGFADAVLCANLLAFRDVVGGCNLGCGASVAFNATRGWDLVTGLGGMDYERLRGLLGRFAVI